MLPEGGKNNGEVLFRVFFIASVVDISLSHSAAGINGRIQLNKTAAFNLEQLLASNARPVRADDMAVKLYFKWDDFTRRKLQERDMRLVAAAAPSNLTLPAPPTPHPDPASARPAATIPSPTKGSLGRKRPLDDADATGAGAAVEREMLSRLASKSCLPQMTSNPSVGAAVAGATPWPLASHFHQDEEDTPNFPLKPSHSSSSTESASSSQMCEDVDELVLETGGGDGGNSVVGNSVVSGGGGGNSLATSIAPPFAFDHSYGIGASSHYVGASSVRPTTIYASPRDSPLPPYEFYESSDVTSAQFSARPATSAAAAIPAAVEPPAYTGFIAPPFTQVEDKDNVRSGAFIVANAGFAGGAGIDELKGAVGMKIENGGDGGNGGVTKFSPTRKRLSSTQKSERAPSDGGNENQISHDAAAVTAAGDISSSVSATATSAASTAAAAVDAGGRSPVKKAKKTKAKEIPQDAVDGYSGPDPRHYDSTRGMEVATDFILPDLRQLVTNWAKYEIKRMRKKKNVDNSDNNSDEDDSDFGICLANWRRYVLERPSFAQSFADSTTDCFPVTDCQLTDDERWDELERSVANLLPFSFVNVFSLMLMARMI